MASASLPIVGQVPVYRVNSRMTLRQVRRGVQGFLLLLWIALFMLTRHQVESGLLWPDLFLVSDPLVAALTVGAAQVVVPSMAVALFFVVLTLVFGRAFCGWVCPLGTLFDCAAHVFKPPATRFSFATHRRMQRWKYYVLALMVFGALFSAQWIYLLDPLALLFRGVAAGLYPALTSLVPARWMPGATGMEYHGVAFAPVALLILVIALVAVTPRFYCRYLCPLGALYGLLSRAPLLRRRVAGCDSCIGIDDDRQCVTGCRMGAVGANPHYTQNHECIRCFSGRSFCHTEAIRFPWSKPKRPEKKDLPAGISRRGFLTWGAGGVALAPLAALSGYHRGDTRAVIRPPRVLEEDTFVDQCIRCAMCVQSCPTQTLQLTHLEAGVAGFWTPAVTPSVGGCKAECNACSVACPTEAIPSFGLAERDKWAVKMGTAILEKGRCISYTENSKCFECVKACPTRAFVVEAAHDNLPKRPAAVEYFRCVGCGLCEKACRNIVYGEVAIKTLSHGRGQPTSLWEHPTQTYEMRELGG